VLPPCGAGQLGNTEQSVFPSLAMGSSPGARVEKQALPRALHNGRVSPRTELRAAVSLAVALVILRSAIPLVTERSLDSDQAVVGLMAKHASEFRNFPLFFYGQNYMLGVQAWLAAPFFWIGGPTALMLRLPLLLINAGVVWGLIAVFQRLGLRPAMGLVAVLPLAMTTPIMSDALLRPLGAAVEPFAWVLILWVLRRRPWWFGLVFCIGTLHREFVVYAAPAWVVAQWYEGRWWTIRDLAKALSTFAVVWLVIDILKRSINLYGPAGGEFAAESLLMQSQQIAMWLSLDAYGDRVWHLLSSGVPDMFGARSYRLASYHGMFSALSTGSLMAGAALALALLIAGIRVFSRSAESSSRAAGAFAWYLGIIGLLAIAGYGLNGGLDVAATPVIRYALFVLFIPVALLGAFLQRERHPVFRAVVVSLVCVWAASTSVDAVRVATEYVQSPPDNPHRELADYLVRHDIHYARGLYWDAYIVTFLARERVIVSSIEQVRISAYGAQVEAHGAEVVNLVREPCGGQRRVAAWCLE